MATYYADLDLTGTDGDGSINNLGHTSGAGDTAIPSSHGLMNYNAF
jgi:hypothetical protein